jgi:3-deoxy-7-phosphoheptulonate synthase / chorismate mutase
VVGNVKIASDLDVLREQVRKVDDQLIQLLLERVGLVKEIGRIKKLKSLPIFDPNREDFNNERNRELARGKIPESMIDEFTEYLANWAREIQKNLL